MHHAALIRQSGNMQHDRPSLGSLPRTGPLVPTDHHPGLCNSHDQVAILQDWQVWTNCNTASTNDRRVFPPVQQHTSHLPSRILRILCASCETRESWPVSAAYMLHLPSCNCQSTVQGTLWHGQQGQQGQKGGKKHRHLHSCISALLRPIRPIHAHPCPYGTCSVPLYLRTSVPLFLEIL